MSHTTLEIPATLVKKARHLGINISALCRATLVARVKLIEREMEAQR